MKRSAKAYLAVLLVCALAFSTMTGFTTQSGFGQVHFETGYPIFEGAYFGEIIGENSQWGIEHAYYVEADPDGSDLELKVFTGEVNGACTVENMVKYMEDSGYKVVAAINGDIFDTATGTPKSTVIHEGNIITSGYAPDRVLAIDEDNEITMAPVGLKYSWEGVMAGNGPFSGTIDYFNVPDGNAGGLFLYNRHYSSSTKTTGDRIEVVIEADDTQMQVDGTIHGTVKQIINGSNTAIGEDELVLSTAAASSHGAMLSALEPGSEIALSCKETGSGLADAREAVGLYYSIVEDGKMVTNGTNVNPRTAVGVKEDGTIVFYIMDGRQSSKSNGLTIEELAYHMIELGCVQAWNLDGGGSSQMVVRQPGVDQTATLKNSPSGGAARAVSNGIMLAYKKKNVSDTAANLHVYPSNILMLPGTEVELSAYASNSLYEKVDAPDNVQYSSDDCFVTGNVFTAGDAPGTAVIKAEAGSLATEAYAEVVTDITVVPSISKLTLKPGETRDINGSLKYGVCDIPSKPELFTFSCDSNIGTISESGLFSASGSTSAQSGNIYVHYGETIGTVAVNVTAETVKPVVFNDTAAHWAKDYIGVLATMGKVGGIGNNKYDPDGELTRAQFLAFLAKATDNAEIASAAPAGFKDVSKNAWYYNYVNWGYQKGIVNGVGEDKFDPNASITREQMAVMLCNYAVFQSFALPQKDGLVVNFKDKSKISPWAIDYVYTVAGAALMNGMGENQFQPQGVATRAQAAKIIYEYIDSREGIND